MSDPVAPSRAQRDELGRMLPGNTMGFAPGQSGNIAGRPSSERQVTEAARNLAQEGLEALAEVMRDKRAVALARVRAVEIILERGYGKAPQRVLLAAETAGLDNPELRRFLAGVLSEMATEVIEGEADPG